MDCQCCQQKEVKIRIFDIEDNAAAGQYNVCANCWTFLKRYMFDAARPLIPTSEAIEEVRQIISSKQSGLALPESGGELALPAKEARPAVTCPDCGMTLDEFKARGRFGCPRDYEVFAEHLDPLFQRVHDAPEPRHKGRGPAIPQTGDSVVDRGRELARLREELRAAVAAEKYEVAAELRDRIQALERTEATP